MAEIVAKPEERLIVALDVGTAAQAVEVVDQLAPLVSFFKVGLQFFYSGEWQRILDKVLQRNGQVFLDIKLPDDIGNTIRGVVETCSKSGVVKFLTLSRTVLPPTIAAARDARGEATHPLLLVVPYVSSLDGSELSEIAGDQEKLSGYIVRKGREAIDARCDGLIVSGQPIAAVRAAMREVLIVSPGIRLAGFSPDEHKRVTTPAQAIEMGSDYLVVGRPILGQPPDGRKRVAQSIIAEIERGLEARKSSGGGGHHRGGGHSLAAKPRS